MMFPQGTDTSPGVFLSKRKTKARREHWCIAGDILEAIDDVSRRMDGIVVMSRLSSTANVAFDRLRAYLVQMEGLGLLTNAESPSLTPEGREFLLYYRQWNRVLERFGLQEVDEPLVIR